MKLKQVGEIAWRWYKNGKQLANKQDLLQKDIEQQVKVLYANLIRQMAYKTRATADGQDYYFMSPLLAIKRFSLPEADDRGKRRLDMSEFDLYRMPYNSHFTNVYPISEGTCGESINMEITQVSPAEENFYVGKADLSWFYFYVVKGRGLDTYNLPPCIKSLDVEATFDVADMDGVDVTMDMASDIINQILGIALGIEKQYYSERVQEETKDMNIIK